MLPGKIPYPITIVNAIKAVKLQLRQGRNTKSYANSNILKGTNVDSLDPFQGIAYSLFHLGICYKKFQLEHFGKVPQSKPNESLKDVSISFT